MGVPLYIGVPRISLDLFQFNFCCMFLHSFTLFTPQINWDLSLLCCLWGGVNKRTHPKNPWNEDSRTISGSKRKQYHYLTSSESWVIEENTTPQKKLSRKPRNATQTTDFKQIHDTFLNYIIYIWQNLPGKMNHANKHNTHTLNRSS